MGNAVVVERVYRWVIPSLVVGDSARGAVDLGQCDSRLGELIRAAQEAVNRSMVARQLNLASVLDPDDAYRLPLRRVTDRVLRSELARARDGNRPTRPRRPRRGSIRRVTCRG